MRSQNIHSDLNGKYELDLSGLARDALSEISKLKPPVVQFCGPISTGGFGNVTENLEHLNSVIQAAIKNNISVFNQVSYEKRLDTILKDHNEYDYPLLDFFYNPILMSGKISGLVFLQLWETSIGSRWEHELGKSLGIPILHLENNFVTEIKLFYKTLQ